MKPFKKKKNRRNILIVGLLLFGGIGSLISGLAPLTGGILITLGIIVSIYLYISSIRTEEYNKLLFDISAEMMAKGIKGNVYTESVKREIKKTGECVNIEEKLQNALKVNPKDIEALEMLCFVQTNSLAFASWVSGSNDMLSCDKISETEALIQRGLEIDKDNVVFINALGIIYDIKKEHDKARESFLQLLEITKNPSCHALIATSYGMSGEHFKGLDEMKLAVERGAKGWIIDFYLGRAYCSTGKFDEALIFLKRAYSVNNQYLPLLDFLKETYYYTANSYKVAKFSLYLFSKFLFLAPRKSFIYLFQGLIWLCIAFCSRVSKKVWIFFRKNSLLSKIRSIMIFPPDQPERTLAEAMMEKGFFDYAIKHIESTLSIFPEESKQKINLAACYFHIGNKQKALELLNAVLSKEPENKFARYNKEIIERNKCQVDKIRMLDPKGKYKDFEIKKI